MPVSDGRTGKTFEEQLNTPDIKDQFIYPYPLGPDVKAPGLNEDPGRIRYEAFFVKMYGDCRKGEVAKRLKPVAWMPNRRGGSVSVTSVNGVNDRLAAVVKDLEKLPADMTQYLVPSAGTYNCRPIANTNRLSVHAFAAAIDINTQFTDYWEWSKGPGRFGEMAEPRFPAKSAKRSSATASSGAPSGITSTRCTSNIGQSLSPSRSKAGRSNDQSRVLLGRMI